jgi:hypothetical protein
MVAYETAYARLDIALAEHKKEMADDCGNISVLSIRYAQSCKALTENVAARIQELTEMERKRLQRK